MTAILTAEASTQSNSLDDRVAIACGHLNACYADLVELIAEAIASEAWHGHGIRSLEQWIGWRTGLSVPHCRTVAALAVAAGSHPHVIEAFRAGELSVDQAGLAIQAHPRHDATVAGWAKVMTLPQLRLAVRASNAAANSPSPGPSDANADSNDVSTAAPPPSEYLSMQQGEDGSWRVHGRLDADRGAIVDAALAEARDRLFRERVRDVSWIDALVDIANRSLDAAPLERRERFRINVFLDPQQSPVATWVNGIAVPDAVVRWCTCDGTISPVFVAEARPISVGRSRRVVPERTRRVVLHRDKQCRNPRCGATRGLEVHHLVHWSAGGTTDTDNLVALCRRCHRDHHLGRLNITGNADQPNGITFRDEHGRVMDAATHAFQPPGPPPDPLRPYRHPLGERIQHWAVVYNPS